MEVEETSQEAGAWIVGETQAGALYIARVEEPRVLARVVQADSPEVLGGFSISLPGEYVAVDVWSSQPLEEKGAWLEGLEAAFLSFLEDTL